VGVCHTDPYRRAEQQGSRAEEGQGGISRFWVQVLPTQSRAVQAVPDWACLCRSPCMKHGSRGQSQMRFLPNDFQPL
jgi:hypothetical protein